MNGVGVFSPVSGAEKETEIDSLFEEGNLLWANLRGILVISPYRVTKQTPTLIYYGTRLFPGIVCRNPWLFNTPMTNSPYHSQSNLFVQSYLPPPSIILRSRDNFASFTFPSFLQPSENWLDKKKTLAWPEDGEKSASVT